jgi:hypothetical protein
MPQLSQFSYHLPPELIAQRPASPRDSSRLLKLDRTNDQITHHYFRELDQLLDSNCVLVRNNTKVIPARIYGQKTTGGAVEILLTHRLGFNQAGFEQWECLTKPGLKPGHIPLVLATDRYLPHYRLHREILTPQANLFTGCWPSATPIPPYIHWATMMKLNLELNIKPFMPRFLAQPPLHSRTSLHP